MTKQRTISKSVQFAGIGLHTNNYCNVKLNPAPENYGVKFKRNDLAQKTIINAIYSNSTDYRRNTSLINGDISIMTVEHLMAAIYLSGIDNLLIEVDNNEIPILDGSAKPIYELIKNNIEEQQELKQFLKIEKTFEVKDENGGYIKFKPSEKLSFKVTIDFPQPVGKQTVELNSDSDIEKVLSARTFTFLSEILFLYQNKLIKGGSLNNAIVYVDCKPSEADIEGIKKFFSIDNFDINDTSLLINNKNRIENEPAYHKALDLAGDISLIGKPITGSIEAYKPGHAINAKFVEALLKV